MCQLPSLGPPSVNEQIEYLQQANETFRSDAGRVILEQIRVVSEGSLHESDDVIRRDGFELHSCSDSALNSLRGEQEDLTRRTRQEVLQCLDYIVQRMRMTFRRESG